MRSYQQMEAYLTTEAKAIIEHYRALGIDDPDLCISMAEEFLTSEKTYQIPEDDSESGTPGK